jgi:hypothetical protein
MKKQDIKVGDQDIKVGDLLIIVGSIAASTLIGWVVKVKYNPYDDELSTLYSVVWSDDREGWPPRQHDENSVRVWKNNALKIKKKCSP